MSLSSGMDAAAVRALADQLAAQRSGLSGIASTLRDAQIAARHPAGYGIEPGDLTIAPWSIDNVGAAQGLLLSAESSISNLVDRLTAAINEQLQASNADGAGGPGSVPGLPVVPGIPGTPGAPVDPGFQWGQGQPTVPGDPGYNWGNLPQDALTARSFWLARPRALLDLPGAIYTMAKRGNLITAAPNWRAYLGPKYAVDAGSMMKAGIWQAGTPRVIQGTYLAASNLKFQNIMDPTFNHFGRPTTSPTGSAKWLDWAHLRGADDVLPTRIANLKLAGAVAGKGFAALGAVTGALQIADAIQGKGDAWTGLDGAVNLVTGIGSFLPPPVGLVFAGAGALYNVGRFLFSGAPGERPADHIANFAKDTVKNIGNLATNHVKNTAAAVIGTVKFAGDVAENAGRTAGVVANVAGKVAGRIIENVWPW